MDKQIQMQLEHIMKLAEFPAEDQKAVFAAFDRFVQENCVNTLMEDAENLRNQPSETGKLGKSLESFTLSWEERLHVNRYTIELLLLLLCWIVTEEKYKEKGLSEEIFRRTLHDTYCKLMECRRVQGVTGVFVGFWYDRFFDLSRFALGRIQFELMPYPFDEPVSVMGKVIRKGDWVVNMHIPSEGPLTSELVEDALAKAREFFMKNAEELNFPEIFFEKDHAVYEGVLEEPLVFVMDSWLLDPDLYNLLPEGNIKEFVSRFERVHVKKEEKFEDGWRVFGKDWEKAPEELPIQTSLQKNIANYLKTGGKLGEAFGILTR